MATFGDERDEHLGMGVAISRRDFLQGVAIAVGASGCGRKGGPSQGGAAGAAAAEPDEPGLRGQTAAQARLGHTVRDGAPAAPTDTVDTAERYDLIVVGAGLSGLAAAWAFRRERGGKATVLLLDAASEVGGHARRNTFEVDGQTLIAYGGTAGLEDDDETPAAVRKLFKELGISASHIESLRDPSAYRGLSNGVFFHPRIDPRCGVGWVNGFEKRSFEAYFKRAPLTEPARAELLSLYTSRTDHLPGLGDKARERALSAMSYADHIRQKMGLSDLAVRFGDLYATDLIGLGADGVSALAAAEVGPGLAATARQKVDLRDPGDDPRYPDGNHTLARCLLKALVPASLPGPSTPDDLFAATLDERALDAPASPVRVRLGSVATRVENKGGAVEVHYRRHDGRVYRVRAGAAVLAGWGATARRILPELSTEQRAALEHLRTTSVLYINVALKSFAPIASAGLSRMYTPAGYCSMLQLASPVRVGAYRPAYEPGKPVVLSMHRYLHYPGLPVAEQLTRGRLELLSTSFADHERQVREELDLLFAKHGFSARRDIAAITVNRWGHGYAFAAAPGGEQAGGPSFKRARAPIGKIAIAGADAGGTPWSQAAMALGIEAARSLL